MMPKSRWQVSKIDMNALDVRKLSSTLLINRFKANSHLVKLEQNLISIFKKKRSFSLIPKEKEELPTDTGKNQGHLK